MPPTIIYNQNSNGNIKIALARDWNTRTLPRLRDAAVFQSQAGNEQTGIFFKQDFVRIGKRLLTTQEVIELEKLYAAYYEDASISSFQYEHDDEIGAYIPFEGRSLSTNDGTAGTFTRALSSGQGNAYFFNRSTQLWESAGNTANIPRFPGGKYGDGILIEGQRKNLVNTNISTWTATTMTVGSATTETKDPEGNNNAFKLTSTAAGGDVSFDTNVDASTDDCTISVFLKSQSGTVDVTLYITTNLTTRATSSISVPANGPDGNGFTRYTLTYDNASDHGTTDWFMVIEIDNNAQTVYAFWPQLEAGANLLFPSSPIPGNALTRNAELLLYPSANIINRDKGSINIWIKPEWTPGQHSDAALFFSGNGSIRHLSITALSSTFLELRMDRNNSGTAGANLNISSSSITQNAWNMITMTYDTTISNGIKGYINGSLIGTSSNNIFSASDVQTNFEIGTSFVGGSPSFCVFDEVLPFKKVLNATEVNHIYNMGRGMGVRRNRWTAMGIADPAENFLDRINNRADFEATFKEIIS